MLEKSSSSDGRLRALVAIDARICECASVTEAIAMALQLHREDPAAAIGIAVGELAPADDGLIGEVVEWARWARELAGAGTICMTEAVLETYGAPLAVAELGAVSRSGYTERIRMFATGQPGERDHDVLAVNLRVHGLVERRPGEAATDQERYTRIFDEAVFAIARTYGGFVQLVQGHEYAVTFHDNGSGVGAAFALHAAWDRVGAGFANLLIGVDRGALRHVGGRLVGRPLSAARALAGASAHGAIAASDRTELDPELRLPVEASEPAVAHVRGFTEPVTYRQLRVPRAHS